MRFLHTADWHIGKAIRGRSRYDEYEKALDQVVEIARERSVDAVLVSGDLHDARAVTAEADALIFDTLLRLHDAGIPVVAIPGNHDSAARLQAFAPLLGRIGVNVVPKMLRPEAGGVVEIGARDGHESAVVACIPFVSPARFADATSVFLDPARLYVSYDENMGLLLDAFATAFRPKSVNVVVGHLFVAGARPGGGEREVTLGADYAVSPGRLPSTASYIALGHIHRPQPVSASAAQARYAGSLIQLDFGERDQNKSVVVVDVRPGLPARAETIAIDAGRKLIDVHASLDELPSLAGGLGDAYLRVFVATDGPVPRLADQVREALPNALDVTPVYERAEGELPEVSLRSLEPREQFISYYKAVHSADPSDQLLGAFDRVYADVSGEG